MFVVASDKEMIDVVWQPVLVENMFLFDDVSVENMFLFVRCISIMILIVSSAQQLP